MQFRLKNNTKPAEIIFTGLNYYTFKENKFEPVKKEDIDFFKSNDKFESYKEKKKRK